MRRQCGHGKQLLQCPAHPKVFLYAERNSAHVGSSLFDSQSLISRRQLQKVLHGLILAFGYTAHDVGYPHWGKRCIGQ
jgi:hypothetical protein